VSVFKDVVNLIQATNYARERVGDIRCLLYGNSTEPEYAAKCVDLVEELGLGPNFKFMGATKTPEKAYNLADVVAFSSLTEGFPFGVIEAMACGKAVVATDVGGVREALEGCGLLVRSRSPHGLADGMVALLKDDRLRKGFEAAALKRTRAEFSLEKEIGEYSDLYDQLTSPEERSGRSSRQGEMAIQR
jgi:glycosyltransferase involved in cell wall biosynthesis